MQSSEPIGVSLDSLVGNYHLRPELAGGVGMFVPVSSTRIMYLPSNSLATVRITLVLR